VVVATHPEKTQSQSPSPSTRVHRPTGSTSGKGSSACWTTVTTSRWRWKSLGVSCGEGEMTEPACLSIVDRRAWLTWVEASVLVDRESARGAWVVTFSYSSRTATLGTMVLTRFHVLEGGGRGVCRGCRNVEGSYGHSAHVAFRFLESA